MEIKTFTIEGMTCASLRPNSRKATQKLSGVKIANVNFATEKMSIQFDEASLSEADIQKPFQMQDMLQYLIP